MAEWLKASRQNGIPVNPEVGLASTSYSFVVGEKGFCKRISIRRNVYTHPNDNGGMAEWLKAAVLKTASRKSGTWVRILLPPPSTTLKTQSALRYAHSNEKRRDAREAEGARLLSEYPAYNGIEGSNPSLSAIV
jgi:hypothetical protein